MLIPSPRTWNDDELVTPAMLNTEVRDATDFALNPPQAVMVRDTNAQTISDNAVETVTFEAVAHDSDGMADLVTNEITIKNAGLYLVTGVAYLNCPYGLDDALALVKRKNTSAALDVNITRDEKILSGAASTGFAMSGFARLNVDDKITLVVLADRRASGGSGDTTIKVNPAGAASSLGVRWVGP